MNIKGYILLINREKKFLETVQKSLLDAGYSVLTATTMSSAVNLLSNNTVVLVLNESEKIITAEVIQFTVANNKHHRIVGEQIHGAAHCCCSKD